MQDVKLSVIIPAYNEAGIIVNTITEIIGILNRLVEESYEIIIIDDHSSDNTFDVIKKIGNSKVRCIRLSRNSGSHVALRAGLSQATGDVVLHISSDGQDDPSCLKDMLDKWRSGHKIVWAIRRSRRDESCLLRLSAKLFYRVLLWLIEARDLTIDLSAADFYLLDRTVVEAINACPERNTSLHGLIAWLGFSQAAVEYDRRLRRHGRSKWSFRKRLRLAKDWIIAFSGLPLKIVSLIGFFIAVVGIIYAIYVVSKALLVSPALPILGWSLTIAIILTLAGLQIIILGVIGEYLWRNLDESRRRPLFFIETTTEDKNSGNSYC
jgi:dolichol-phosphate mannosyltransferase